MEHNKKIMGVLEALNLTLDRINNNSEDLQDDLDNVKMAYVEAVVENSFSYQNRFEYSKNGMLAEILKNVPVLIYDHPMIKMHVNTAFVDNTGRMFISDSFYKLMKKDSENTRINIIDFVFGHEAEHLRRAHLSRMLDFDHEISNVANDIRINSDLHRFEIWKRVKERAHSAVDEDSDIFKREVTRYFKEVASSEILSKLYCRTEEEFYKWGKRSEEDIAAELMREAKENPSQEPPKQSQSATISFKDVCTAVADDLASISALGKTTPAVVNAANQLSAKVRALGPTRGNVPTAQLDDIMRGVYDHSQSPEVVHLDLDHSNLPDPKRSGRTGNDFIDCMSPSHRAHLLLAILNMRLQARGSSASSGSDGDTIKITDLDLPFDPDSDPTDQHMLDGKETADMLKEAGLEESAKKLGYDDLEKINEGERVAKEAVAGALGQASEDMNRMGGGKYPGAHMVDHATAQMQNLYKPVISIRAKMKESLEESSKESRFDQEEPWMIYNMTAEDLGLDSEMDVPYMGSYIPGGTQRPLYVVIIDTSGSVSDHQLKRFISEAIGFSMDMESIENPPEIIITFADTICRGEPLFVNQDNALDFIKKGVPYGGRGGTNFTASVEHVFTMFEETGAFSGRRFDGMFYMTDTYDSAPTLERMETAAEKAGFHKLPPMVFLAPKECYNERFNNDIREYAEIMYFDENAFNEVDMDEIADRLESRNRPFSM